MSKVTELAEREAHKAETEPDDGEAETEPGETEPATEPGETEPATEPAAPQPDVDPVDIEAFTREAKRHEKAVAKLLGPDIVENVCSACQGVGYVPPGAEAPPEPQHHADFQACETCNGYGDILTGSLKEGHVSASCPTCAGTGYLVRQTRHDGEGNGNTAAGHADAAFGSEPWMGDPGIRPAGQPGFGQAGGASMTAVR